MAYSVFRVPNSIQVLPTAGNQIVSTIVGASGQSVDLEQWQNYTGSVLARIDNAGNFSGVAGTFSSNLTVLGNTTLGDNSADTITVSGTPTFIQNSIFQNALTVSGTLNANGGTIATNQSSATLFASPTIVNAFAAATTLNLATSAASSAITIGSSTSTTIIAGNLTVNGTTTTVNSTTVNIDDLNINVASDVGTAAYADGGGITVGSGLGITMNYDNTNTSWTSSQNFNIATTKTYKIAGTDVLSATTLGAGVVLSSLQKVGTIATGVWQGTSISTAYTDAKVVSVTTANSARIAVGGTTANPTIDLATVTQSTGSNFVKITLDSYGRVTGNTAVASGDIPNLSASQITAGTLAVAQGGTNLASYTVGDLLYASATTTIGKLAAVASGQFLVSNGVTTAPSYRSLSTPDITGALGYTPANSGSVLSGTGSTGKIALWNGASSLTNDTELAYDSTSNILSIAHGNITASNSVLTIGTTGTDVVDSFGTGVYRTAKYLLQARNSGSTEFQVSEVLVIHDGTTAYLTEYGKMYTGANPLLTSLTVSIAAGSVALKATAASAGTVVRFTKITMNN